MNPKRPLGACGSADTIAKSGADASAAVLDALAVSIIIGCGERTAARLMREQKIRSRKVGRSWRCTLSSVIYYMTSTEATP